MEYNESTTTENHCNLDCLRELQPNSRDHKRYIWRKNCQVMKKMKSPINIVIRLMRKIWKLREKQVKDIIKRVHRIMMKRRRMLLISKMEM
jgi:hypothetical protein